LNANVSGQINIGNTLTADEDVLKARHATIVFVVTVVVVVVEEDEANSAPLRAPIPIMFWPVSTSFLAKDSMDIVVELPFKQLTTRVQFSFSMTAKLSSHVAAQPWSIAPYTNLSKSVLSTRL